MNPVGRESYSVVGCLLGLWRCASGARLHKSCQLSLSLPGSHLFARVGREAVLNGSIGTVPSTEIKKIKLTALEFKQNILNPPADLTRAVDGASRRARAAMKPEIFATSLRHPREQFEAWREWFSSVFEVTPKDPIGDGFLAETRLWNLGGFAISRTSASPVDVVRTKVHLRRDPVDHWVISYCARGAHSAVTAGTVVEVPARVPYLWSLGQEFLHERTHVDRVQFILARDTFRDMAPLLDAACGSVIETALGRLLGNYMIALESRLPDLAEADFPGITKALGAMVAAAVAPSAERTAVAKPQIDFGRKERVRQAVRKHLRTPTLKPKTLSRLVGMSRSNLYRLFEDMGGVARYIHRERLLEAHAIITSPATIQSISAIAEDLCFADASSFSRAFKREFGHTPGEVRSAALAGLAPPTSLRSPVPSAGADFGELLRGFSGMVLAAHDRCPATSPMPYSSLLRLRSWSSASASGPSRAGSGGVGCLKRLPPPLAQALAVRIAARAEMTLRPSVQWCQACRKSPRAAACTPSLMARPTCCMTESSR